MPVTIRSLLIVKRMCSLQIVGLQKKRNESIPNYSEAKYDESNSHQNNFESPLPISRPSSLSVPGAPFTHPRNNVPF